MQDRVSESDAIEGQANFLVSCWRVARMLGCVRMLRQKRDDAIGLELLV